MESFEHILPLLFGVRWHSLLFIVTNKQVSFIVRGMFSECVICSCYSSAVDDHLKGKTFLNGSVFMVGFGPLSECTMHAIWAPGTHFLWTGCLMYDQQCT